MRLIVCWSTGGGSRHSCGAAHDALKDAGYDPEVQKAYSTRLVPNALQVTSGRKEAVRRTGKSDVPVLILDDDTTVAGSKQIVAWAKANPAAQAGAPSPKPAA
jgi:hypothetical protein